MLTRNYTEPNRPRNQSVIEWGRFMLMFSSIIITYQIENIGIIQI